MTLLSFVLHCVVINVSALIKHCWFLSTFTVNFNSELRFSKIRCVVQTGKNFMHQTVEKKIKIHINWCHLTIKKNYADTNILFLLLSFGHTVKITSLKEDLLYRKKSLTQHDTSFINHAHKLWWPKFYDLSWLIIKLKIVWCTHYIHTQLRNT